MNGEINSTEELEKLSHRLHGTSRVPLWVWIVAAGVFTGLLLQIPNSIRIDQAFNELRSGLTIKKVVAKLTTSLGPSKMTQIEFADPDSLATVSSLLQHSVQPYRKEKKTYDFTIDVTLTSSTDKLYFLTLFVDRSSTVVNSFFSTRDADMPFGLWFDDANHFWTGIAKRYLN